MYGHRRFMFLPWQLYSVVLHAENSSILGLESTINCLFLVVSQCCRSDLHALGTVGSGVKTSAVTTRSVMEVTDSSVHYKFPVNVMVGILGSGLSGRHGNL